MARRARPEERSKAIERRLREEVAACTRRLNDLALLGYSGHVGARRPRVGGRHHAARWAAGLPVHPAPSHVRDPARGRAAARSLGPHHAMLIRAHGQVVTAETVPAVLVDCVHFVENAEAMYRAASLGAVRPLTADEIARFLRGFDRD